MKKLTKEEKMEVKYGNKGLSRVAKHFPDTEGDYAFYKKLRRDAVRAKARALILAVLAFASMGASIASPMFLGVSAILLALALFWLTGYYIQWRYSQFIAGTIYDHGINESIKMNLDILSARIGRLERKERKHAKTEE